MRQTINTEDLISIYEVCHAVNEAGETRPLLERILGRIMHLVQAERGFITLVEADRPQYDAAVQLVNPHDDPFTRDFEIFSRSTVQHALETRAPVSRRIHDDWEDATDSMRASKTRYVMAAPLVATGEAVGVLYVDARQVHTRFSEQDEVLVGILAEQAAIALRHAALQDLAARPSAEATRLLAENLPQGIVIVEDGRVTYCNPIVERFSGCGLAGFPRLAEIAPAEEGTAPVDWWWALQHAWSVARRQGAAHEERAIRLWDGDVRTLETMANKYPVGQTETIGLLISDVTERRLQEHRTFHAQRLETVGTMAEGIAHEFNNVLAVILGNADLLQRSDSLDEPARESLEAIIHAVRRGRSMSHQLLAFSGRAPLQRAACELNPAVEEVARSMQHIVPDNVRVTVRLCSERFNVMADRAQIQLALINLALNAADAMPAGGTLGFETRPDATSASPAVAVLVSDTGEGIAPEHRDRMFEPFFTTRGPQRSGQGLATSYGIVKSHGGGLTFESTMGQGTTFAVVLPATVLAADMEGERPPTPSWRGQGELVLFVDDDAGLRSFGTSALKRLGFRILIARDGREALQQFRDSADRIHIVIMDVSMPNLSGGECLRQLRALDTSVPVLMMSGNLTQSDIQELLDHGATAVLTKPFDVAQLVASMQRILQPSR